MSFFAAAKQGLVRAFILAFLAALSFAVGAADDAARKAQFQNRLGSVKALSSALARDAGADRAEVKAAVTTVAARQKEAEELAALGEFGAAQMILDEGYALLTRTLAALKAGTGYAGPAGSAATEGVGAASRQQATYERSLASARALLDAARRASADAGGAKAADLARIEATLAAAEQAGKVGDYARAEGLAGDALKDLRPLLVSLKGGAPDGAVMQAPTQTSSSATAERGGMAGDAEKRAEVDRIMKSASLLRDAVVRLSTEKNADSSATVARIDALTVEARNRQASDPPRALQAANEANQIAKDALAKLR